MIRELWIGVLKRMDFYHRESGDNATRYGKLFLQHHHKINA